MSRNNDVWVAALRGGDESAIAELRDRLCGNLRKALAGRKGVDDGFLDDAVQDALVRILDRLNQFSGRSRFLTWATSIAIHVAMAELRRSRWKDVSLEDILSSRPEANTQSLDAEHELDRQAVIEAMQRIIDTRLTDRQRIVLQAELRGMPQAEIARHLGSNRNAVYKLTHDARRKLKRGLESVGYTEDLVAAVFAD